MRSSTGNNCKIRLKGDKIKLNYCFSKNPIVNVDVKLLGKTYNTIYHHPLLYDLVHS